jgi:hypothetical protein
MKNQHQPIHGTGKACKGCKKIGPGAHKTGGAAHVNTGKVSLSSYERPGEPLSAQDAVLKYYKPVDYFFTKVRIIAECKKNYSFSEKSVTFFLTVKTI